MNSQVSLSISLDGIWTARDFETFFGAVDKLAAAAIILAAPTDQPIRGQRRQAAAGAQAPLSLNRAIAAFRKRNDAPSIGVVRIEFASPGRALLIMPAALLVAPKVIRATGGLIRDVVHALNELRDGAQARRHRDERHAEDMADQREQRAQSRRAAEQQLTQEIGRERRREERHRRAMADSAIRGKTELDLPATMGGARIRDTVPDSTNIRPVSAVDREIGQATARCIQAIPSMKFAVMRFEAVLREDATPQHSLSSADWERIRWDLMVISAPIAAAALEGQLVSADVVSGAHGVNPPKQE